jgi:hypothetical protein
VERFALINQPQKINKDMNSIISEIVRVIDLNEPDLNPLNHCEIVDYEFKTSLNLEFSKRYGRHHLQQLCNFIDSLKYVRTKQSHKATVIPLPTTGSLLKGLFGNEMNASNFLKKAIEVGLLEVYDSKYQFNACKAELNKSRTYAYNYKVEKELKKIFGAQNIVPSISKSNSIEYSNENSEYSKYNIRIDSNFRIPVKNKREFETFALAEIHKKYPILGYVQNIVNEINNTHYKDYPELQIRFEPKFTYSKSGVLTKIGIRATSQVCGSKKGKKGKFFGILRSQVRRRFGIHEFSNSDVKSSIPRVTKSLNQGKWIPEDIDIYESILEESKRIVNSKTYKTPRELEIYTDLKLWMTADTRQDCKTSHMRGYFSNSFEEMNAKILYKGRNQNLQNIDYIKEICKIIFEAIRNVEGPSLKSEIFLWESCIYLIALKKVLDSGNFCVLFYDSFESQKPFDRRQVVEQSFYEFLEVQNSLKKFEQKSSPLRYDDLSSNAFKTIVKDNVSQANSSLDSSVWNSNSKLKNSEINTKVYDSVVTDIKSTLSSNSNILPISKSKISSNIQITSDSQKFFTSQSKTTKKLRSNTLKYAKGVKNGLTILQDSS